MSDAARIYIELGETGAQRYADLIREENYLLDMLNNVGNVDAFQLAELNKIQEDIYQLKQDAGLVSSR
jgi:hypothetical protein